MKKNEQESKNTELLKENLEEKIENQVETAAEEENLQESLQDKYNSLNDSYLRLMAEFDNYRKRTLKEKADLIKNGGENVIISILPIVDNFERALANMETSTDVNALKEGVELIYQQIIAMLKQQGVREIITENTDFDTEYHEAISTIPVADESLNGKIIDCTQKGYMLNNKTIRHAKVVVGE